VLSCQVSSGQIRFLSNKVRLDYAISDQGHVLSGKIKAILGQVKVRLGQSQVRSRHVGTGQVKVTSRSAHARTSHVQVRSVQDKSGIFRSMSCQGFIRLDQVRSIQGHVRTGQVKLRSRSTAVQIMRSQV